MLLFCSTQPHRPKGKADIRRSEKEQASYVGPAYGASGWIHATTPSTAVPSDAAETEPTQRDRHLRFIAGHGRAAWQKASGYTKRARAEAAMSRFKQVVGDGLRSRTEGRRTTEVEVAVHALNRMLELGRQISVRIA